ncbi:MAG: hypothetical protein V3T84_01140 [Phycisphaerales bacterium]
MNFDFEQLERFDDETLVIFYEVFAQCLSYPIEDIWSGQVVSDVSASKRSNKLMQIKMLVHQKAWAMSVKSVVWPLTNFVNAVTEWTISNPAMAPEVEHALVASTRAMRGL